MTIQAVHCGDLHLDKNFNIPDPERAATRKEDLNRNFAEIVDYAIRNHADLFLISGDVFDRVRPSNDVAVLVTRKVRELKERGIAVVAIGGNHDIPKLGNYRHIALDTLSSAGLATVFSRFDEIQRVELQVDGQKICVSGKSYDVRNETRNPLKGCKLTLDGDLNVLMLHGSLRGLNVNPTLPEMAAQNPFYPEDIKPGLDYLALGHYHNFYDREHNGVKLCNPGSIEKMTWAETSEEKGFVWAELSNEQTRVEFVRLKTRPMEKHELWLERKAKSDLLQAVISQLETFANPDLMVRLALKGQITVEEYQKLQLGEIYRRMRGRLFHLAIDRSELEIEGFGRIFLGRVDNPIEAFTKRIDAKIANASADEERKWLAQVRELGTTFLGEMS